MKQDQDDDEGEERISVCGAIENAVRNSKRVAERKRV